MSRSVWNQAGTWEEKDCSEWAKVRLKGLLGVAATDGARVIAVDTVEGHVHVLHVRGKPRVGMEISLELAVEVTSDGGPVHGAVKLTEVSETDVDDFDMELTGDFRESDNKKRALGLRAPITDAFKAVMSAAIERACAS